MVDIRHIMKYHTSVNIPLNYAEAYNLGVFALQGSNGEGNRLIQIQSIAALCALHNRKLYTWRNNGDSMVPDMDCLPQNAAEQIAGICAAIFEHDIAKSEFSFLNPDIDYAMDNCGMGGDWVMTANVSTLAAFIAAAGGIPMCKHGSPANTDEGRYGSSDFVHLVCSINTFAEKELMEQCLVQTNFAYTEATEVRYKRIHLQTHKIAMLPHMNDIIGPITNPLSPRLLKKRVLGLNHLIPPRIATEAYLILNGHGITNLEHGLFIRGYVDSDRTLGIDELSICPGGTQVVELKNGKITEFDLFAEDFGLEPVSKDSIIPVGDKGNFSLKILKGEIDGPPLQMVLANAALLFYLAGRANSWKEAYQAAREVFESGAAYNLMVKVREFLKSA